MTEVAAETPLRIAAPRKLAQMIGEEVKQALIDVFTPLEPDDAPPHPTDTLVYVPPPTLGQDASYRLTLPSLPMSVYARLTTSGAAGNRNVALEYRSADGARFLIAGTQPTVPASQTQTFCWHPEAGSGNWPVEDAAIASLPQQWLGYNQIIAVTVYNGDTADRLDQVRIVLRQSGVA